MKKAPARKRQSARKKALIGKTGVRNRKPKLYFSETHIRCIGHILAAAQNYLSIADKISPIRQYDFQLLGRDIEFILYWKKVLEKHREKVLFFKSETP